MKKFFALFIAAAISIGASAATLLPIQLLNPAGSTSGQAIISTGASSAPAWGGVSVSGLAAIASNSVIANATNSSAIPTAVTVTGCNGAAQALQWTNGTGFGCNSAIATSGANSNITSLSSPTITTPNIVGVTNGSAAATGSVGQIITSGVVTGLALPTNTATNIASISLTAGQWLIWGNVQILPGANSIAAGGYSTSISTTSATANTAITNFSSFSGIALAAGASPTSQTPAVLVTISAGATYFLVANANMTGAGTANGVINALRLR